MTDCAAINKKQRQVTVRSGEYLVWRPDHPTHRCCAWRGITIHASEIKVDDVIFAGERMGAHVKNIRLNVRSDGTDMYTFTGDEEKNYLWVEGLRV